MGPTQFIQIKGFSINIMLITKYVSSTMFRKNPFMFMWKKMYPVFVKIKDA